MKQIAANVATLSAVLVAGRLDITHTIVPLRKLKKPAPVLMIIAADGKVAPGRKRTQLRTKTERIVLTSTSTLQTKNTLVNLA